MELSPETRIGPYLITARIGAGGMGDVYRARDMRLDRDVALKVLRDGNANRDSIASRFQREAKTIAALSHPNILAIYDCGLEGELFYIATELLDGETLRTYMASGKLPWRRAVKIAASIVEGLRSAHSRGIVHRDLKPENVFITRSGMVKILDFGLAHIAPPRRPVQSETLTSPGMIVGTASYMAPEQVRGESVGPYTDIFALGCLLYEMLSGRKAFGRRSAADAMTAVLRDHPTDLRKLCDDIPEELVVLIEHCLEREPQMRFQDASDLLFALTAIAEHSGRQPLVRAVRQRARLKALSAALIVVAIAGAVAIGRHGAPKPVIPPPVTSLAVMPFVNATGDPSVEYLADGLTEAIINNLSPVKGFTVISRNAAFSYKGRSFDTREVRTDLGVDAVVSGSLRVVQNALQVSVELVDARDGHQIWGERYDQPVQNLSAIERELSTAISAKLQMRLSGKDERRIRTHAMVNPEAYTLYQQGLYEWNKRTPDALRQGIVFFNRSIKIDPNYAPAHAGIAESYVLLGGIYEAMPPREAMPMARDAALRALALEDSAAAHACLGLIFHEYDWNWPAAEQEFRKAIALDPTHASAHQWYGQSLVYRSRFEEGVAELKRAAALDPLSLVSQNDLAQAYWIAGQYDAAIAQGRRVIEIEPRFWLGHWLLGLSLAGKGDLVAAAKSLEQAVKLEGTPAVLGTLAAVYARSGRRAEALKVIARLEKMRGERYVSPAAFGVAYAALGDLDRAYAEVDRAIDERASLITALNVVPIAEPIRRDPRYPAVARRIGLPPLPDQR